MREEMTQSRVVCAVSERHDEGSPRSPWTIVRIVVGVLVIGYFSLRLVGTCARANAHSRTDYGADLANARRDPSCHSDCEVSGACGSLPGRPCVAISQGDCVASAICRDRGKCTLASGRCVAGARDDCSGSRWCAEYGHCSLTDEGCLAASDDDCARSAVCETHDHCQASKIGTCWRS